MKEIPWIIIIFLWIALIITQAHFLWQKDLHKKICEYNKLEAIILENNDLYCTDWENLFDLIIEKWKK